MDLIKNISIYEAVLTSFKSNQLDCNMELFKAVSAELDNLKSELAYKNAKANNNGNIQKAMQKLLKNSTKINSANKSLHNAWVDNEYTYATNGYMLVRCISDMVELPLIEDEALKPKLSGYFQGCIECNTTIELPTLSELKSNIKACKEKSKLAGLYSSKRTIVINMQGFVCNAEYLLIALEALPEAIGVTKKSDRFSNPLFISSDNIDCGILPINYKRDLSELSNFECFLI